MGRKSSGNSLQTDGAAVRWLLCGVFVSALAMGQAGATVISKSFLGFPPISFAQHDKIFEAGNRNLPLDFATLISTRSGIVNSFIERLAVPEPGSLAMFGTGILGLGAVLRRKFQ